MSKKSKTVQQTQESSKQTLDPAIRNAVFGADGTGGYVGALQNVYQNNPLQAYSGPTYAGLNSTQQGALGGTLDFLRSPGATAGYDALNRVGNSLANWSPSQLNLQNFTPQQVGANPMQAASFSAAQMGEVPNAQAASVGGSGINFRTAADRILKGEVDNPEMRRMMQGVADTSTENFLRNVAPQMRGSSIMSGGYGGSRQGIMEGIAAGDLNNSIQRSNSQLLGNLYESAQNRMAGLTGQLAGQESGERIAGAQLGTQANLANADNRLRAMLAQAGFEQEAGRTNAGFQQQAGMANQDAALRAGIANQGAGLNAAELNQRGAISQFGLNEDARQRGIQNQVQGAGLLQNASQIPLQNFQTALNVGNVYQQDQQGQYSDAYKRFMEQQMLPWQNINMYGNALRPFAELGAGREGQSTTTTTSKSSDPMGTALGIASMLAAPMTGGASLGMGGFLGGAAGGSIAGGMPNIISPSMQSFGMPTNWGFNLPGMR